MRQLIDIACEGEALAATLDAAPGTTGLLIVSGGNEVRIGAHRGMAMLAARLAADGMPVFRFDRRGVGESTGVNGGYLASAPDITAAAAAFRHAQPQLTRLVGYGNCDAATALALFHRSARIDALVLANPWLAAETDALPPAAAIRAHYAERLLDPATWRRALAGGIDLRKLAAGVRKAATHGAENERAGPLARALADAPPTTILVAERDNTARAFLDAWQRPPLLAASAAIRLVRVPTASHSFAGDEPAAALEKTLRAALMPDSAPLQA